MCVCGREENKRVKNGKKKDKKEREKRKRKKKKEGVDKRKRKGNTLDTCQMEIDPMIFMKTYPYP